MRACVCVLARVLGKVRARDACGVVVTMAATMVVTRCGMVCVYARARARVFGRCACTVRGGVIAMVATMVATQCGMGCVRELGRCARATLAAWW